MSILTVMSRNETSLLCSKAKNKAEISPIVEMTSQMVHSFSIFKQALREFNTALASEINELINEATELLMIVVASNRCCIYKYNTK